MYPNTEKIGGEIDKTIHILDLAPPTKVVYGSDGGAIPEIHFAGAKIAKRVLQDVLSVFVKHEVYDEDQAHKAAKLILADNVNRIYNF